MLSKSRCHQSSHSDKILMLKLIFFVLYHRYSLTLISKLIYFPIVLSGVLFLGLSIMINNTSGVDG